VLDDGTARYLAIITDGNRRWAHRRRLPINQGYAAGADTLKGRVSDAIEFGIRELTVFSFSTENWSRPASEVHGLIELLAHRIATETPRLHRYGVRMCFIGRREQIPAHLVARIEWAEALTKSNHTMTLYVALNYGARSEILDAAQRLSDGDEDEDAFRQGLYAPDMHDPDLIIRTAGERRLSNYLLWQAAYSELVFRDELWPDFTRQALHQSLTEYTTRRRRYGGRAQAPTRP
jgi:undecaprenyl diphosphate synthase